MCCVVFVYTLYKKQGLIIISKISKSNNEAQPVEFESLTGRRLIDWTFIEHENQYIHGQKDDNHQYTLVLRLVLKREREKQKRHILDG